MKTYPMLAWPIVHYGIKGYRENGQSFFVDAPEGVDLVVQRADCSPPVLVPDRPWERGLLNHFHLVREGDRLRLWYSGGDYLCYAESSNGFRWEKPVLNRVEFDGSMANNIAFAKGWPCVCWFEDGNAAPEQRFKAVGLEACWIDKEGKEVPESLVRDAMTHRTGNEEDNPVGFDIRSAMAGYVSPDRFRWTKLNVPSLMDLFSDTQAVVWYDPASRLYRGYFRMGWAGKRAVGYAETADFTRWPLPRVVFHAAIQDGLDTDAYTSCYCPYPGDADLRLLFPAMYHHVRDTVDIHLAVSRDGQDWDRPSFDPIIPLGEMDGLPEQSLYASPDLVTLPDGRWGLMYLSTCWPHNMDPTPLPKGQYRFAYRWARWQPHRLAGIAAKAEGQFTILPQPCQAGELRLNYKTEAGGWVRVELADRAGGYPPVEVAPLPDHTFDQCDVLTGDALDRVVTWRGKRDLSPLQGKNVAIHIRLHRATVFSVTL